MYYMYIVWKVLLVKNMNFSVISVRVYYRMLPWPATSDLATTIRTWLSPQPVTGDILQCFVSTQNMNCSDSSCNFCGHKVNQQPP